MPPQKLIFLVLKTGTRAFLILFNYFWFWLKNKLWISKKKINFVKQAILKNHSIDLTTKKPVVLTPSDINRSPTKQSWVDSTTTVSCGPVIHVLITSHSYLFCWTPTHLRRAPFGSQCFSTLIHSAALLDQTGRLNSWKETVPSLQFWLHGVPGRRPCWSHGLPTDSPGFSNWHPRECSRLRCNSRYFSYADSLWGWSNYEQVWTLVLDYDWGSRCDIKY